MWRCMVVAMEQLIEATENLASHMNETNPGLDASPTFGAITSARAWLGEVTKHPLPVLQNEDAK